MPAMMRRSLEYLCAALLMVIVVVIFTNVIGRYFFSSPLRWTDEVAQFLFLWLAYLGALAALMGGRHYSFSNLIDLLPPKIKLVAKTLSDILVIAMLGILVWTGVQLVDLLQHQRSPALDVPIYFIYSALPLVAALMALVVAYQIAARLLGRPEAGQASESPQLNEDPL